MLRSISMFFEGSEKKAEIVVAANIDLFLQPEDFWTKMVAFAGAKILSKIENESCKAYLLSESSLFVWKDHITMITCGTTTLVKAVNFFIDHFKTENISALIYERKNEYFPHLQKTNFFSDVKYMKKYALGSSFRFGQSDEHHLMLFHMDKPYQPSSEDVTFELLMYNLQGNAKDILNSPGHTIEQVRNLLQFDKILPDFQVDDYLFQPCGYSLNAIKGPHYYTVHVTPEENGSYVSFETNVDINETVKHQLSHILEIFKPESFDIIWFRPDDGIPDLTVSPYVHINLYHQPLDCGYNVNFSSYYMRAKRFYPATKLEGLQ